jgi:hypothetical protein
MDHYNEYLETFWQLLDQYQSDIVKATITGLVIAPATGAMIEYFRARTAQRKRRPLLALIENSAFRVEGAAVFLRIAQKAFQELGFTSLSNRQLRRSTDPSPHPDPVKAIEADFQFLHQVTYTLALISYEMDRDSGEAEKYLSLVTPHLRVEQVSDLVTWASRIRSVGEGIGNLSTEFFDAHTSFLNLNTLTPSSEELGGIVEKIVGATDGLKFHLDNYENLDEAPSNVPQTQWSLMPSLKNQSIRAKAAKHFKDPRLKRKFEDAVKANMPKEASPITKLQHVMNWFFHGVAP